MFKILKIKKSWGTFGDIMGSFSPDKYIESKFADASFDLRISQMRKPCPNSTLHIPSFQIFDEGSMLKIYFQFTHYVVTF